MQFGLEQEAFIYRVSDGKLVTPDDRAKLYRTPTDSCGYLAEFRSAVHTDLLELKYNFLKVVEETTARAKVDGFDLIVSNEINLPSSDQRAWLRTTGKTPFDYSMRGNLYGKLWEPRNRATAGMHVHFSNTSTYVHTSTTAACGHSTTSTRSYHGVLNIPKIIQTFDKAFAEEIKGARRLKGEYEMKPYGFEYRSLPANINLDKVIEVLKGV